MDDSTSNLPQMIAVIVIIIAAIAYCIKKFIGGRKRDGKSVGCSGCALKDNCLANDKEAQLNCQTPDNKNDKSDTTK